MNRALPIGLAALLLIAGIAIWIIGVTNDGKVWSFTGALLTGLGVALLIVTFQKRE